MTTYGTLPTNPIKISLEKGRDAVQLTHVYITSAASASAVMKTPGNFYSNLSGAPNSGSYECLTSNSETMDANLRQITNTYTVGFSPSNVPEDYWDSQSSREDVTVQLHPDFAALKASYGWNSEKEQFVNGALAGMKTFVGGIMTINVTRHYYLTKPSGWFEAVGKLSAPAVGTGWGDDENWLIIASNLSRSGDYYVWRTTHLYSAIAWPTDIYDTL